jgi:hypothetical protein
VSALLLVEVIDTAGTLLDAILAWIVAAAFVATVCLYAAILTGAWATRKAWRAVRRGSTGSLAASEPECDPSATNIPTTPTAPSWARADKEAA